MRIPRDLSGPDLVRALATLGYAVTRETGTHLRLTTTESGQHHVTVPRYDALRLGTLSGILADVAEHFGISRSELVERLSTAHLDDSWREGFRKGQTAATGIFRRDTR